MQLSRLIILGTGIFTGVGAVYFGINMEQEQSVEIQMENISVQKTSGIEVLVVAEDVSIGDKLNNKLTWQVWPEDFVTDRFVRKDQDSDALERIGKLWARGNLYTGEPLLKNKVLEERKGILASLLPQGMRALAVRIGADSAAGGFILPNDYVDIIVAKRAMGNDGHESFDTQTLLKNIKVLAIDQEIQEDEEGKKVIVGETATLELNPEQAEIITAAQQTSEKLVLSLRSFADREEDVKHSDSLLNNRKKRSSVKFIKSGEISVSGVNK